MMAKKSGPARATRLPADQKGRAQLKTVGNQKDRGKAELAKLKDQLNGRLPKQRNAPPVGGKKLADAIEAFGLNFDGLKGGPVVKKNTTNVLTNKLPQSRPYTNEP